MRKYTKYCAYGQTRHGGESTNRKLQRKREENNLRIVIGVIVTRKGTKSIHGEVPYTPRQRLKGHLFSSSSSSLLFSSLFVSIFLFNLLDA
jgi:hypothetical protein